MQNKYSATLDHVNFSLKEPCNFSFLKKYGKVFKVFDDQDSGNICFGTEDENGVRRFIKYAGAKTVRGTVSPAEAIRNLKATVPLYETLRHETLIPYLGSLETESGFGLVFQWTDGQCMGRMYPESHTRFMAMNTQKKLDVFRSIQHFLAYVHKEGYVAIDFYDGSILYDFSQGKTLICDIDFFAKKPCFNHMGRMWGSSVFQSPEEYEMGAAIDELTNVYTLGAFAFALFGGFYRDTGHWTLNPAAFDVACRAVSATRAHRQQSIAQFIFQWENAVSPAGEPVTNKNSFGE